MAAGGQVIGTTRTGKADWAEGKANLSLMALELSDAAAVKEAVEKAHTVHGRIDVLLNNAGYGLLGAIEEAAPEEAQQVFAVNFFGPLYLIQAALPFLRKQRSGHIVNISSIAGIAPMAGSGLYAAAKSALEGMSHALAQELAPLGIRVTVVEPGAFRTDFLSDSSRQETRQCIADYDSTAGKNVAHLAEIHGKQAGDPARAARAILAAVGEEQPPLHLVLGSDAFRRSRERLDDFSAELGRWEAVSRSTDYPA